MSKSLQRAFFEEAAEALVDYEQALVRLENAPHDRGLLDRIFRCAHNLKSGSALMGLHEITRLTHALETLLASLRTGRRAVTRPVVDTLLASEDALRNLLDQAKSGKTENPQAAEHALAAIHASLAEEPAEPKAGVASRATSDLGPARLAGPTCHQSAASEAPASATPVDRTGSPAQLEDEVGAHSPSAEAGGFQVPPVLARRASDREEATSIRVSTDRVDRLINLAGELIITQSIVSQTAVSLTQDNMALLLQAVAQMDRHARELHERIMAIRMVPVKHLFGRFPRMVRDLTAAVGKQATLEIRGEETELDKTVIERISDPLTHLVRNAIDHGLEFPHERRAAGKPEAGRLRLEATQQGSNVFVEVADDGNGLDRDRIVARAVHDGLITSDQRLTDEEAFALIFRPGFSTAERVTEISGRGVGMDVVKRNLEALGGGVTIRSERGRGTCFRIKLPLTVAILDGQMVRVADQVFVLPMTVLLESVRPASGSVHGIAGAGEVVMVRGRPLPLLRLHELFGVESSVTDPTQGLAILVENEDRQAALLVDDILGQQQVVIKSLETNFKKVEGIAGATILGDGRVALLLDVAELMGMVRARPGQPFGQVA